MAVVLGVLGLAVGVLLNLIVERVPAGRPLRGMPECPGCGADLQPTMWCSILAWGRRERCPICGSPCPLRRAGIELGTVALFIFLGGQGLSAAQTALTALYLSLFLALAVIDLEHRIVPNRLVVPAAVLGIATSLLHPGLVSALVGGLVGYGILFLFYQVGIVFSARMGLAEEGLGAGDVKLAGLIGLVVGWPAVVPGLVIGFTLGGVVALGLLLTRTARPRTYIPYAPFLLVGGALALLYGRDIAGWYLGFYL